MRRKYWLSSAIIAVMVLGMDAAFSEEEMSLEGSEGAQVTVYKTVGDAKLRLYIFAPEGESDEPRAAIVFFFGGGWNKGTPGQFFQHCKYFAARGMVAISAEYRVKSRHGVTPFECVTDGKSAIRWVREHAAELGIDPDRIAAGGGSAGGHIAACAGVIDGLEQEGEDYSVSSRPNALVLFNPAVNLVPLAKRIGKFGDRIKQISPVYHVREGLPPTIIFHGTKDPVVPFKSVEVFTRLMQEKGNQCELVPFEGQAHGFFNYGRDENVPFNETIAAAVRFLTRLGFLTKRKERTSMMNSDPKGLLVYIGTYTREASEGIYVYRLDLSSGALRHQSTVKGVANPSFLTLDHRGKFVYAVNESVEISGKRTGAVSAFAVDGTNGDLTFLNQQVAEGRAACHITIDDGDRCVVVANYGTGSVAVFPIEEDGRLAPASDFVQHEGSGPHPQRQKAPHPHSVNLAPSNHFVYVPDLGIDRVMIYRLDAENGKIAPNDPPFAQLKPGAGPRHMAFHPNGRYVYVINELDCTITAFAFDAQTGGLEEIQTVPTLPEDFTGENTSADIHVSPSGKFLYASNRGHDSIAIFEIDQKTGTLTLVDHEPTQGKTPRNFAVDPTGTFLLAANQDSDNIVVFRIDHETGKLTPTGHVEEVAMPVCIKMMATGE